MMQSQDHSFIFLHVLPILPFSSVDILGYDSICLLCISFKIYSFAATVFAVVADFFV